MAGKFLFQQMEIKKRVLRFCLEPNISNLALLSLKLNCSGQRESSYLTCIAGLRSECRMKLGWGHYLQTTQVLGCPGGPACFGLILVHGVRDIQGQFVRRQWPKIILTHCKSCTRVYAHLLFCTDRRRTGIKTPKEMSRKHSSAQQQFPLHFESHQNHSFGVKSRARVWRYGTKLHTQKRRAAWILHCWFLCLHLDSWGCIHARRWWLQV